MEIRFEELSKTMILVHLRGRVDLETIEPFVNCLNQLKDYEVIFNMQALSFVGSNGISSFVDSIRNLARTSTKAVKFCGVGTEFRRIFMATLAQDIEIYEDIHRAQMAFRPRVTEEYEAASAHFHPLFEQPNSPLVDSTQNNITDRSDQIGGGVSIDSVDSTRSSFIENPD